MKYIKTYNESIKHLLKPKSEDDIKIELDKMDSYSKLIKGCEYDMLWLVKQSLKEGVDPSVNFNIAIETACESGSEEVVEFLLNDERVDPTIHKNSCVYLSSINGHVNILKLLLKDKRVDPSDDGNVALWETFENYSDNGYNDERYADIIRLLVNDKRVRNRLTKDDYKELWDNVNLDKPISESIRHLLKPKSEEDILKSSKNLSPEDKLEKGCRYNIPWLVKQALEEGVDPVDHSNLLVILSQYGYLEIVKILLADKRMDPTCYENSPIAYAYFKNHIDIIKELLKDDKVRNSLSKIDLERYEKKVSSLNESINVSKYDWEYSRINNKVGNLYYASKYKLSMINLYELSKSLIDFNEKETMLMTIITISILTKENKEKIKKLFELASSYNITQKDIDNLVNKFTTIKNIFKIVASKYEIVINDMSDLLVNTNLLIPFINVLISLIEQQKLNIDILSKPLEEIQKELGEEKYKLMFNRIERKLEIMLLNNSKFKDVKYTEPYRKSHEFKPIHIRTKKITL